MKLVRARVQNYRSVVDSGEVKVAEGVTVVIGKNEQGKTNFLKALASFNRQYKYFPRDFPNHLRPRLEEKSPSEIPIVTLWLAPEPAERIRLEKVLKKEHLTGPYRVTRFFDGHYTYEADV